MIQARAQSAEDRLYILKYDLAEKEEQIQQAEVSQADGTMIMRGSNALV